MARTVADSVQQQDRIKLGAILGEAPIESDDDDGGSTFLTHLDPDLKYQGDDSDTASQTSSRASSAVHQRPPLAPSAANKRVGVPAKEAVVKGSPDKDLYGPGGPGSAKRFAGTPPSGGPAPMKRGSERSRKEALAVGKPQTPADMAGMFMAQKAAKAAAFIAADDDKSDDDKHFAPYGQPAAKPPVPRLAGLAAAPGYEKLLSPEVRGVLEDARSWRSTTQTMRTNITASPPVNPPLPFSIDASGHLW